MNTFRLPVGDKVVCLSALGGAEDLLLAETATCNTILAMTLANRLTRDMGGAPMDWGEVAVTDLDAFIATLRRMLIGDWIRSDTTCPAENCGRKIDIAFSMGAFLDHHTPSFRAGSNRGWCVEPVQESGWYRLTPRSSSGHSSADPIDFRLPTPNDQLAVSGRPDADVELARRCLQPADAPAKSRRAAEAMIEAMAPCLSCDIKALCPECGATIALYFESRQFCLWELRSRAASIYADVDVLARRYHWSESEILSLPRARRVAYVEMALQA